MNNNSTTPTVTMDNGVAQGDKERPPPQGECCPRLEFGTVNDVNVTDQLPPGVEDNHIHLTDDDAVFAPKFERLLKEK